MPVHTEPTQPQSTPSPAPARTMHAVQYDRYGEPDVLRLALVPVPELSRDKVLVRISGTSVNGGDVFIRSGKLKLVTGRKFPRGAGFDFVGAVAQTGSEVTAFQTGDRVWGFIDSGPKLGATGAAAEYVLVPADWLAATPTSLDLISAAALPGAAGAALEVLNTARITPGEQVLIRGAAGGVGSAAVQLAAARGAQVTALVRAAHLDRIRELGAHDAYDYATTKPEQLEQFDVIIDTVGRGMRRYRRRLAFGGRYLLMAVGGPRDVLFMLTSKVFGTRRIRFVQAPPSGKTLAALADEVDAGHLIPVIDDVFPLADIAAAHRAAEAGGAFGKQIIRVD